MAVVVLEGCGSYDAALVRRAVHGALSGVLGENTSRLGGKRILLKPNLAAARKPERGVTTHPEVVGAAIDFFKERGCAVSVGDSPAGAVRGVHRVWEKTGMLEICRARGAQLVNFEAGGWVEKTVRGRSYRIARAALECDHLVNLPKFKTHVLTLVTGAVKNTFGCIPGFAKSAFHLRFPKPPAMSTVIVDVFNAVDPWINLVDAVEAMDGNGPSSGRLRHLGLVAASTDAVALDVVLSRIVGIDPVQVPTTREALVRRGSAEPGPITVVGDQAHACGEGFDIPSNWHFFLIPDALSRLALRWFWVKPRVEAAICTGCGDCAAICAASAIGVVGGKAVVRQDRCVSCLCCIEACPAGAIEPQKSRLARLVT
jgi:uncharacterized protein (DUF362 family)/Pyruvate/2-oxoacid:ferredoxin oxidoreductase delta subunit